MAKGYIAGIGTGSGSGGGGGISPTLLDEEMVKYDDASGLLVGTGDINTDAAVTFGAKDVFCNTLITEAGSIDVGPALTITDRGGNQQLTSNVDGTESLSVTYVVDDTGSQAPTYKARDPIEIRNVLLSDDSTSIIGFTGYLSAPTKNRDIHSLYLKFINPATNLRFRGTSVTTGEVIKYFPSRHDFNQGVGVSVAAGEQILPLYEPFSEVAGTVINVEFFADASIDILGDGVLPWLAADTQLITSTPLVTEAVTAPESVSTSLIYGGVITQNTPTTIDISAGSGRIVSIDALGVPTVTNVSWDAFTNVAITNIVADIATRIAIDINGAVVQLPIDLTPEVVRDYINLASISHPSVTIGQIVNNSLKSQEVYSQLIDNFEVMGVTKKTGLIVSPNANLTFDKTAGEIQASGGGNEAGTRGPNIVRIAAESPSTFLTFLGVTDTLVAAAQTSLDPAFYDNGSGTKVAIGAPAAQATIVYVYQSILEPFGVLVMYGQTVYTSLSEAVLNAPVDVVEIPITIVQDSNLIGRFAVRSDATDLTDENQAVLLAGVKFGSGIEGNLSGSVSGGGDFLGPASSSVDEIVTFADATGKVGKAGSDISALNGTLTRIAAASDIDFVDGANGTVTFTTGGISVKNPSATPKYRLTDNIDQTIGGVELNGNLGTFVRLHRSLGEGVYKSELRMHDGYVNSIQKTMINSILEPDAQLQVGEIAAITTNNTSAIGTPLVINSAVDNGGNTPNGSISINQWRRAGISGESFGNIANWTIERYENSTTNSRTMLKLQLTHANIGDNIVPDIMEWKSNGDVSSFGTFFAEKVSVNETGAPNGLLQVNAQAGETNLNTTDVGTPLVLNDDRNNGGITPNGFTTVSQWRKAGVNGQTFGNVASWAMERYENVSTRSRTAVKLSLTHDDISSSAMVDVMEWRSNGQVSMPTTTAALIPPKVTTAQMNAIAPDGLLINTDDNKLYIGNGVSWVLV